MICPEDIDRVPTTSPKTFSNWARAYMFTAATSYRPTTRGQIVEIIRQAEERDRAVKWTGSLWSFMGNFASTSDVVETDDISGVIPFDVLLGHLDLVNPAEARSLVQVRGGTKVYNVNRLLHGLPAASNGGGADENDLDLARGSRALPTLGGSGGQSLAGVLATGSHGGDVHMPPLGDAVAAIHLIGPGGQEWWIERSQGFSRGSETEVQDRLRQAIARDPRAAAEMCRGIRVRKSDALFHAVMVSVGRMGFVYSLVLRSVPGFKLAEDRRSIPWERLRPQLSGQPFFDLVRDLRYLNILINPFAASDGTHDCKLAVRRDVASTTPNLNMTATGDEAVGFFCRQQDVRTLTPILIAAIVTLGAAAALLTGLIVALSAAAAAVAAIPFVGWVLAAAMFAAVAALTAALAVVVAASVAVTALLTAITVSGPMSSGQLVATVIDLAYRLGLKDLMKTVLTSLLDGGFPLTSKVGVSWKVMDTYGYAAEDFCQKVASIEIAFDVAADHGQTYLGFIDDVLAIFADLYDHDRTAAGLLALRYTQRSEALIGMTRFPITCHIEIPLLRDLSGTAEAVRRIQQAAIRRGGVPHWGQLMDQYTAADVAALHGNDLVQWRRQLAYLIREAPGAKAATFSNAFTQRYNLEPWDETPVAAVRFRIVLGEDSLADTAWPFREDRSQDFAHVILRDGTRYSAALNQDAAGQWIQWNARGEYARDVPVPAGTTWSDVARVEIEHRAAGPDIAADNWTMNEVTISSVSTAGVITLRDAESGSPLHQFRKNDNQVWGHSFP